MREASEKNRIFTPNLSIFIGIGLGVISCFVLPFRLIAIIGLIILAYCVLRAPEIGVIAILFLVKGPKFHNLVCTYQLTK